MAILRREAAATDFAWAMSLTGESVEVEWDGDVLSVSHGAATRWSMRMHADGTFTAE